MSDTVPVRRRRLWPVFLPLALVVVLAALWTAGWFYAASLARTNLAEWREREAKEGRVYTCGTEAVGGYPFRIEVRCSEPTAELRSNLPPVSLKAKEILAAAQIYQPTLLITEFTGPMTIAEPGQPPSFVAKWRLGQTSVRGTPAAPESGSIVVDDPSMDRVGSGGTATVLKAKRIEIHGRIAEGSAASNPVIDLVLRLTAASAPELHPLVAEPLDADVTTALRGLSDFAPKPWPVRFREIQARGGSIEISKARVQQGDVIAVSAGTLSLTPGGGLDGQIQVTIVGLEHILKVLDVDRMVSQGEIGSALNALDRMMPGFGQFARQNAAPGIVAGLGAMSRGATLEGKTAVTLPLRFSDGLVFLGPIPIGRVPPLF
jgi:hypothetical protein